jgi:hypothetical protein
MLFNFDMMPQYFVYEDGHSRVHGIECVAVPQACVERCGRSWALSRGPEGCTRFHELMQDVPCPNCRRKGDIRPSIGKLAPRSGLCDCPGASDGQRCVVRAARPYLVRVGALVA